MKKAIILLSGVPSIKARFIEEAKKSNWLWQTNFREFLGTKANGFYWDGERNEEYFNFTYEFLQLVNKYFKTEEKYLKEKIEKFLLEDGETKKYGEKIYDKFVLIIHGVSKELVQTLEGEYGVFKVHVSRKDLNSNIELYDTVLYEDDEKFEEEVNRVIGVLTDNKQKENN